jgi:hypothetical protein
MFGCTRRYGCSGCTPGSAHTATNGKRTGNVHSDAARQGTLSPDAVGTVYAYRTRSDSAFSFWTRPCQGIFLLDAARQGAEHSDAAHHGTVRPDATRQGSVRPDAVATAYAYRTQSVRAFSFWTQACQGKWRPDDASSGTTGTLAVKAPNVVTQLLLGIVVT